MDKPQSQQMNHILHYPRIKRLVRKTICFSKSILMHDVVIGLFINRFEFGLGICIEIKSQWDTLAC